MDWKTRKTASAIVSVKEDLKDAMNMISSIEHENCSERTLKLIDEAADCIMMSQRFLDQIDMSEYGTERVGENIRMKKNRPFGK